MVKHVLTVTRTEFQPAEQLDELRMKPEYARVKTRTVSGFLDGHLHLLLYLLSHLLYPRRMNTTVCYELLYSYTGYLPPHRIKT